MLFHGTRVGTLYLTGIPPSVGAALREYPTLALLILLTRLAVAGVIAVFLQFWLAKPILAIAEVAQRIAKTHRFEERVPGIARNELGVLAESLNVMLEEIGRHDAERAEDREKLQQQVAERNRANAELMVAIDKAEEASRLKGEFLANVSHEIRTPMNGIIGFTQLALGTEVDQEQRDYLETVASSAESLLQLLNDILDVSKIESGKMQLDCEPFSLRECVETSVHTMCGAAQQKQLEFTCTLDPNLPETMTGDELRIRQVLLNLVGNAIKFTAKGSVAITVMMEPATDNKLNAHFVVRDTGVGIPLEKQKIIFEAFRQADGSTTRRYGGSGLGLAISTGLVKIMGGRIWVESEPGHGAAFHFTAPFGPAEVKAPPEISPQTALPDGPPLCILVAEDNAVSQRLVTKLLTERGHDVTLAPTGRAVLEFVEHHAFDLILMDIQMPEMDGVQATTQIRLREGRTGRHLPIVAMTAHAMVGDRERYLASGMDGYISKPIHSEELMALIAGILAQRHAIGSV